MRSAVWLVFPVATLGMVSSISAALITDGNFEASPDLPGAPQFSTSGDWSFSFFAAVNDGIGTGGSKGVRLESGGLATNDPTAVQTVTGLTIGTTYLLSWDLDLRVDFGGLGGDGRSFGVFLDTQTFGSALFLGEQLTDGYQSHSTTFVATSTTHTLIFAGELDGRSNGIGVRTDVSYNLDNVSLVGATAAVPEPASLCGWGLCAIAGLFIPRRPWRDRSRSIITRG